MGPFASTELRRLPVASYRPFVRSQLRRYGAAPSELDDLTQEVWLVALARSPELVEERAARAWLSQVCRRVAAGERRARNRTPLLANELPEPSVGPLQVKTIVRELDDQDGVAALQRLSEEMRDVLSLYGSGELTMREVAELLGEPEATVYSRYRASLDLLGRELRRGEQAGVRPSTVPPASTSGRVVNAELDREALADAGELLIYRADGEVVLGRIGNVVFTRWRKRFYQRTLDDLGSLVDLAHERMRVPVVLVNDGDPDLRLPNASERANLRAHLGQHSRRVAMAVDILNTPVTRLIAAIVQGALMITRAPSSFAMVPSLEQARRWCEPYARTTSGALEWSRIAASIETLRRFS